ncbi:hypothetical protein QFZ82_005542 [Streptomyces sp. V4I23]|nr:hypothetical protein [Streptomyces sp. V4I23]
MNDMDTAAEGLAGGLGRVRLRAPAGHEARQYVDVPAKSYSPYGPASIRDRPAGLSGTLVPASGAFVTPGTGGVAVHGAGGRGAPPSRWSGRRRAAPPRSGSVRAVPVQPAPGDEFQHHRDGDGLDRHQGDEHEELHRARLHR